jgi:hypothetical protein
LFCASRLPPWAKPKIGIVDRLRIGKRCGRRERRRRSGDEPVEIIDDALRRPVDRVEPLLFGALGFFDRLVVERFAQRELFRLLCDGELRQIQIVVLGFVQALFCEVALLCGERPLQRRGIVRRREDAVFQRLLTRQPGVGRLLLKLGRLLLEIGLDLQPLGGLHLQQRTHQRAALAGLVDLLEHRVRVEDGELALQRVGVGRRLDEAQAQLVEPIEGVDRALRSLA